MGDRCAAINIIRQNRRNMTFTIFNAKPATITVDQVIQDVGKSLRLNPTTAILGVHKDTRFKSRFNIYFRSALYVEQAKINGMQIGDTIIHPQKRMRKGYIPNLPMWELVEDVKTILSEYGDVKFAEPRKRKDGLISGWNFGIITKDDKLLPDQISQNFTFYDVHHRERKYFCRGCNEWHHKQQACMADPEPQPVADAPSGDTLVVDEASTTGTITLARTVTPEGAEQPTEAEESTIPDSPPPTTVQEEEPPSQSILHADSPPPANHPPTISTDSPSSHTEEKEMSSDREVRKRPNPANQQKSRKKKKQATHIFK